MLFYGRSKRKNIDTEISKIKFTNHTHVTRRGSPSTHGNSSVSGVPRTVYSITAGVLHEFTALPKGKADSIKNATPPFRRLHLWEIKYSYTFILQE